MMDHNWKIKFFQINLNPEYHEWNITQKYEILLYAINTCANSTFPNRTLRKLNFQKLLNYYDIWKLYNLILQRRSMGKFLFVYRIWDQTLNSVNQTNKIAIVNTR